MARRRRATQAQQLRWLLAGREVSNAQQEAQTMWTRMNGKKTNMSLVLVGLGLVLKALGVEWADYLLMAGGGGTTIGAGHKLMKGT